MLNDCIDFKEAVFFSSPCPTSRDFNLLVCVETLGFINRAAEGERGRYGEPKRAHCCVRRPTY